MQVAGDERGDLVLEAIAALVRERQVVRVGADAQRRLRARRRSDRRPRSPARARRETYRPKTYTVLPGAVYFLMSFIAPTTPSAA